MPNARDSRPMQGLVRARSVLALIAVVLAGCHGRPRTWSSASSDLEATESRGSGSSAKRDGEIVEIDLTRGAPEASAGNLLGTGSRQTYFRLITLLKELASSSANGGVLVRFGSAHFGWARAEELAGLFAQVRESKKHVVCHADGYGNASIWIALRGCDRVWVSPAGGVETIGVADRPLYPHRFLTRQLRLHPPFLPIAKFKKPQKT